MLYKPPTDRELLGSLEQDTKVVQFPCAIEDSRITKPHESQKDPELLILVPACPASSHDEI